MICMVAGTLMKNMLRTFAPFVRNLVIMLDFMGGQDKRWFILLIEFHSKQTFLILMLLLFFCTNSKPST